LEAEGQDGGPATRGHKPEVANADEPGGEHVEEEAAQELLHRQSHQALLVAVPGVSPAEGDLVVLKGDQTVIGDGHAVGVAAEITENLLGTAEGRLAVDYPVPLKERAKEGSEGLAFRQRLEIAVETQSAVGKSRSESLDKLAAEDSPQHRDG
jgi:hypothetical protein